MRYLTRKKLRASLRTVLLMASFIMMFHGTLHACWKEVVEIRPIKIKITDKSTGLPLEGIPVYYELRTYWPDRVLFILRNPEGTNTKVSRALEEYVSDSNGEVMIPARKISLRRWKPEKLYDENIFINIDNRRYFTSRDQKIDSLGSVLFYGKKQFINPVTAYRGFNIYSSTWDMDPKDYGGTKFEIADALWNGNGLNKKDMETFVIELERWDSDENINKE
jgi:hypothetical protein